MKQDDDLQLVGGIKQRDRLRPMPVTVTGVSCISTFWLVATFLILSGLIVAGGFPNWLRNRVETNDQARDLGNILSSVDLGMYYLCYNTTVCNQEFCDGPCREQRLCGCYTYLDFNPPSTINTTNGLVVAQNQILTPAASVLDILYVFVGSIVYAFGIILLLISLLVGAVAYCKPRFGSCSLFLFAFVCQALAGIAVLVGLAFMPAFFGLEFTEQFCGSGAGVYNRGQCTLDWALFLSMVVGACSLYLPALAIFSMNISDGLNAHICC